MWLLPEKQVIYRSTLLFCLSVLLAYVLNISSPVWSVLIVTPIATMTHFNILKILMSIAKQIACLATGMLIAEVFYQQFLMMWVLSILFVYIMVYRAKYHERSFILMALFFFFSFGLIKTSEGVPVESSIYSMVEITSYVIPLAWLLFAIFPAHKYIPLTDIANRKPLTPITPLQCAIVSAIISLVNLLFMLVQLQSAIFCMVVINAAVLTFSLDKLKQHISLVIPIQIGGCVIGLIMNAMLLGQGTNLLLSMSIIGFFSFVFIYAHFTPKHQFKAVNGYEVSLLRATFIPFSLYSEAQGINPTDYIYRAYDMLITFVFLMLLWKIGTYLVIHYSEGSRNTTKP